MTPLRNITTYFIRHLDQEPDWHINCFLYKTSLIMKNPKQHRLCKKDLTPKDCCVYNLPMHSGQQSLDKAKAFIYNHQNRNSALGKFP
jgi:hypothetical protein